jgi:8-oxo-dGTP pyrophosphatase MutT (NUDIX family)
MRHAGPTSRSVRWRDRVVAVATTAIVAEILIVGLEAATWVCLLVLAIFGRDWIDLDAIKDWDAVVTVLLVAVAYVLGVLVDRAADSVLKHLPSRPVDKPAKVAEMRLHLLATPSGVTSFLEYQRTRMRIARATVLNLAALAGALAVFLQCLVQPPTWQTVCAVAAAVGAAAVTYLLYRRIECAYVERLSDAYAMAKRLPKANRAAAVCYTRVGEDLKFVVVRTSEAKRGVTPETERWTFPKGRVDRLKPLLGRRKREGGVQEERRGMSRAARRKGRKESLWERRKETLWEAAEREAWEESGVRGKVDREPFAYYNYPPAPGSGRKHDHCVAAFLLKCVDQKPEKAEDWRDPCWLDPEEARERLTKNREPRYVSAIEPVIEAALRKLD